MKPDEIIREGRDAMLRYNAAMKRPPDPADPMDPTDQELAAYYEWWDRSQHLADAAARLLPAALDALEEAKGRAERAEAALAAMTLDVTEARAERNAATERAVKSESELSITEAERDLLRRELDFRTRESAKSAEKNRRDGLDVRTACRRRMPLDGADAQCLEHLLAKTEAERDEARRACCINLSELSTHDPDGRERTPREECLRAYPDATDRLFPAGGGK